jgi:hypothetical protein
VGGAEGGVNGMENTDITPLKMIKPIRLHFPCNYVMSRDNSMVQYSLSCSKHDKITLLLLQQGMIELFIRLVNFRDADTQSLGQVHPHSAGLYSFPPQVTMLAPLRIPSLHMQGSTLRTVRLPRTTKSG